MNLIAVRLSAMHNYPRENEIQLLIMRNTVCNILILLESASDCLKTKKLG